VRLGERPGARLATLVEVATEQRDRLGVVGDHLPDVEDLSAEHPTLGVDPAIERVEALVDLSEPAVVLGEPRIVFGELGVDLVEPPMEGFEGGARLVVHARF